MSAFKCSDKHMQYIADGLFSIYTDEEEKKIVEKVNKYIDLNIRALNERYQDSELMYKGFEYITEAHREFNFNKYQLLKALSCLKYQCSEGDIPEEEAYKELREDIYNIMYEIIYTSPEYNNTHWEII